MHFEHVISATRLHFRSGTTEVPEATVQHLKAYVRATQDLGIAAVIAVNTLSNEVYAIAHEEAPDLDLQVLPVPVWGAFVPALNTLLGEAQRRGKWYIMYQSLEVCCPVPVLRTLLDHFTADTLVVGPVMEGHVFKSGEQPLTGRTTPWNTLALWSTRKLGLTGFLSIADGMPEAAKDRVRRFSSMPDDFGSSLERVDRRRVRRTTSRGSLECAGDASPTSPMGSAAWWDSPPGGKSTDRLSFFPGDENDVPAGVEEVTAIALLQHILGNDNARALLVQLPARLQSLVSWKADWGGDEARRQWHEYKMASKVTRPAAQIKLLFGSGSPKRWQSLVPDAMLPSLSGASRSRFGGGPEKAAAAPPPQHRPSSADAQPASEEAGGPTVSFGLVQHLGESVAPPWHVHAICMASVALFFANFASAFATAFHAVNVEHSTALPTTLFVGLFTGGVFIPMPLSLFLMRFVTRNTCHVGGLLLFAGTQVLSHVALMWWSSAERDPLMSQAVLLASRFLQGLGSGVMFQARVVLASISTEDQHLRLHADVMFAADMGLSVGALLPGAASVLTRDGSCSPALALASAALLQWIWLAFPRRLHKLPDRVRFPDYGAEGDNSEGSDGDDEQEAAGAAVRKAVLLLSGTMRAFVQSGAIMTVVLLMRDMECVGGFRQAGAVAAFSLLQAPFDFEAARLRLSKAAAFAAIACVAVLLAGTSYTAGWAAAVSKEARSLLVGLEIALLLVALGVSAPRKVSQLNQLVDAEHAMVILEWLKAYVGPLLGPVFALLVQAHLGYGPLVCTLGVSTLVVTVTA